MARHVIDAAALLHLLEHGRRVDPEHQLAGSCTPVTELEMRLLGGEPPG